MEVFLTVSPMLRTFGDQKSIFIDDLLYLSKVRSCSKHYIIYPEFDTSGRLHYHGIIMINDKVKWYKSVLPTLRRTLGFCDIKPIKSFIDKLRIMNYIRKDWMVTKEILNLDDPVMPKHRKRMLIVDTKLEDGITKYYPIIKKVVVN